MRRFRRVHTTISLSGCLGWGGGKRGDYSVRLPSLSIPRVSPLPQTPSPRKGNGQPLIWSHREQGGAAEAGCGPEQKGKGPMWVSRDYEERQGERDVLRNRHTETERYRERQQGPCKGHSAGSKMSIQSQLSVDCILPTQSCLGAGQSKAEVRPFWG